MTITVLIILAGIGMIGSAFFCGTEIGIYCLNRIRLRLRVDQGDKSALLLARVLENEQDALASILIGTNVMGFLLTGTVAYLLTGPLGLSAGRAELYTTLILSPVLFVFCEVLPKSWFEREPDRLMYRAAVPLRMAYVVFRSTGLVWLLGKISEALTRRIVGPRSGTSDNDDSRANVLALLREAMLSRSDEPEHGEMVDRIMKLSRIAVSAAMLPRTRMIGVAASSNRSVLTNVVRKASHSRLPVYEGDTSRVVGMLHVLDALADPSWRTVREKMQKVMYLDPQQTVASAIVGLQRAGQPMAIVVDRSGRALGLVTLKDLLEEIVGDLKAW